MKNKKVFIEWQEIDYLVDVIVSKVLASNVKYAMVAGITRGGLIPAVMLSHRLNLPMLAVTKNDMIPIRNQRILLVDEIYDTGKTISDFTARNPHVDVAVLYHNLGIPDVNYYGKKVMLNDWLVFPWESENDTNPEFVEEQIKNPELEVRPHYEPVKEETVYEELIEESKIEEPVRVDDVVEQQPVEEPVRAKRRNTKTSLQSDDKPSNTTTES